MTRFNKVMVSNRGEIVIRIRKTFARHQEYTPVFLEINGRMEEFLI